MSQRYRTVASSEGRASRVRCHRVRIRGLLTAGALQPLIRQHHRPPPGTRLKHPQQPAQQRAGALQRLVLAGAAGIAHPALLQRRIRRHIDLRRADQAPRGPARASAPSPRPAPLPTEANQPVEHGGRMLLATGQRIGQMQTEGVAVTEQRPHPLDEWREQHQHLVPTDPGERLQARAPPAACPLPATGRRRCARRATPFRPEVVGDQDGVLHALRTGPWSEGQGPGWFMMPSASRPCASRRSARRRRSRRCDATA